MAWCNICKKDHMICDKCDRPVVVFIGVGSIGQRLCDVHYQEWKDEHGTPA